MAQKCLKRAILSRVGPFHRFVNVMMSAIEINLVKKSSFETCSFWLPVLIDR